MDMKRKLMIMDKIKADNERYIKDWKESRVKEITGDLLFCGADCICHQTNYDGVMGAGLAAAIHDKLLTPAAYEMYQRLCATRGRDLLGIVQCLPCRKSGKAGAPSQVLNLFCQDDRPTTDGGFTRYDHLRNCLKTVELYARTHDKTVAIPGNMGCGIAGGNWLEVRTCIELVFGKSPVSCTIVWKE